MGPYAETIITTRKTDVEGETDNSPGGWNVIIGLILLGPALWVVWFMGLYLWAHIGLIIPTVVIGLSFWACGRYGTNRSLFARLRYRTQRKRIRRRLSDIKKSEKR